MSLSTDQVAAICGFDQETIDAFNAVVQNATNVDGVSAAGALSLTREITELTISGTKAYTLAAPTAPGQRKKIRCVSAANTPAGTLTVSSPDDTAGFVCPATFFFDAVGQELEFEGTSALKWRCIRKKRVGYKTLVIGTTVTTGICDMSNVLVSGTGTVASTAADKVLPKGAAIGERVQVTCSVAASTPHADLGGTFLDHLGAAKTSLDDFTVVGERGTFVWTGAAWQLEGALVSTTLAFA